MQDYLSKNLLRILGVVYIILGIVAFYNAIRYTETAGVLWFSYAAFFIIGIGLLTRSSYLIGSQFNIIFIPYLFWNIDFFHMLFTGNSLWGITDYFFTARHTISQLISLQHIFTIPISLLAIYLIKLKRKDFWKFSAIQVTIFFFLVRIFTNPDSNVNCVFKNCIPFQIVPGPYVFSWFASYAIMIAITTFLVTRIKIFWPGFRTRAS
jgi:hypothetical protein